MINLLRLPNYKNALMKATVLGLLSMVFGLTAWAQPTVLYTGLTSTSPAPSNSRFALNAVAGFRQARFQANQNASASSTGWAFHTGSTGSPNYNPCFRPYTSNNTLSVNTYIPTSYSNGAKYNTGGGGSDGLLPAITSGNYYTFNVSNNATADNTMQLLETNFNPVTINSLTQLPLASLVNASASPMVTITTSVAPASGENVYLRYTTNNYTSSTIVQFTFSGSTGTAFIPANVSGTNVSYYVFSSNKTASQLTADVSSYGQAAYDMATLNLLNNSNSNYQYTVNSSTNPVLVQSTGSPANNNSYATLNAAFTAVNSGTHTGAINIAISGNINETSTDMLNASGTGSASYTGVYIYPTGGAMRTITASGFTTLPLIDLVGADRVTIDGLNTGGNGLTITNPSTNSWANTIRLYNDACRNIIRNCTILGSNTSTTATPFGTIHITTGATTGNDSNVIANNLIGDAAGGLPAFGIYSFSGSSTISNDTIIVANNEIYNWFSTIASSDAAAIWANSGSSITSNSFWTISGNKFYQTAARTSATNGNNYRAIKIGNSTTNISGGGHTINNNVIGFNNAQRTGTMTYGPSSPTNYAYRFVGIDLYLGTAVNSTVIGNTIASIALSTTSGAGGFPGIFSGIVLNTGIATISSDTVGYSGAGINITSSNTGAAIWGIYASESTGTPSISGNFISNFATGGTASIGYTFWGIQVAGVASPSVNNNIIGGTGANDISIGTSGTTTATSMQMFGINCTSSGAPTIQNNIVRNLTLYTTGTSTSSLLIRGIDASGGGSTNISGNQVYNLINNGLATGSGTSAAILGIHQNNGTATSVSVNSNIIYNLIGTPTGSNALKIIGMRVNGPASGAYDVQKNNIHSFKLSSTSTTSSIQGIQIVSGAPVVANNMIRMGIDGNGAALTGDYAIAGIDASIGSSAIYYNSVYVGGSTSGTTNICYAINAGTSSVTAIKNNIAWNARTNGGASAGKHIALAYNSTTGAANITNNLLLADTLNGGTLARNTSNSTNFNSLNALQLSGFNGNGVSSNPQYLSATGTSTTGDLHISTSNATEVESGGVNVSGITDDIDGNLRNATTPDIGADEGSFIFGDLTAPSISYTIISNLTGTSAPATLSVTITDRSGVKTTSGNKPRLYYKKCSDANQIVGNTSSDNGWKYVEATNSGSPFTFNIDYSIINGGSVSQGTIISYFVVAQDNFTTSNVGISDNLSFGTAATSVALTTANLPTGTPNTYVHQLTTGTFSVGSGGNFSSITGICGCFQAINASASSLTGNVTLSILNNLTEPGTFALSTSGPSNVATVIIVPNAASADTIIGTIADPSTASTSTSTGLFRINTGAKLKIDGRFSGSGRYLVFRNTNSIPANTSPIFLLTGATASTIDLNYTVFEGNNQYSNGSIFGAGMVNVFTSAGVSTINVDNCWFRDARGGNIGKASSGVYINSATSNVTITNNQFENIYNNPIQVYVAGTTAINYNSIYASSTLTNPTIFYGINVGSNGGGPYTVNYNTIGGSAAGGSGTPLTISSGVDFRGINLAGSATYNVQGDTIQNINLTNTGNTASFTFNGIYQSTGSLNTGSGNVIGHHTNSALGITINSGATHSGIYQAGITNSTNTVSNNIIANITSNNTGISNVLRGIWGNFSTGTPTITGNTIHDLITMSSKAHVVTDALSSGSTNSCLIGILITASSTPSNITVSSNTIYALKSNNTGATGSSVIGIETGGANNGAALNSVYLNKIYGLENKSTATATFGAIVGIRDYDKVWTFAGNSISLTNGSNTNNINVYGFMEGATSSGSGVTRIQLNSIYIGGVNSSGAANSAAYNNFYASSSNTDSVKNNIFVNVRTSSGSGTGKHYVIEFTSNPTSMSQYCGRKNVLYAINPSTLCYSTSDKTFTTWKALGTSYDATSINSPAYFVDPVNGDMHTSTFNCLLDGVGESVVPAVSAIDIDGASRNTTAPDIGADEFTVTNFSGSMSVNSANIPDGGTKFTSLTANYGGLFNALNTCAVSGNMIAAISSDITESGDNALNQWTETGGSNFRLRITSDGTTRTLSKTTYVGNLFKMNGADRVTIDGGNRNLIFVSSNSSIANSNLSTWQFYNGATSDSIINCVINTETDLATEGNILLGTGTNSVVILNNLLTNISTTDFPVNNIYSASATNSAQIVNNELSNSGTAAINISNIASGFNVAGNSIYRTLSPSTSSYTGILTSLSAAGTISGNYIGGQQVSCGGSPMPLNYTSANFNFTGINTGAASVDGNVIQNISVNNGSNTTTFTGINASASSMIGLSAGNIIGHPNNVNSISFTSASSITTFRGINAGTSTGNQNIKNNIVSNITIQSTTSSASNLAIGIQFVRNTNTTNSDSIIFNSVKNISHAGINTTGAAAALLTGIQDSSPWTAPLVISNNTISGLSATTTTANAVNVRGIYSSALSGLRTVANNKVYGLLNSATSISPQPSISGFLFVGGCPINIYNNMISLSNAGNSSDMAMTGIGLSASSTQAFNVYYNTVYIGGTQSGGSSGSGAILVAGVNATYTGRNNLLFNNRTGGTGTHGTIASSGTGTFYSNYNLHVASGAKMGSYNNNSYDFTAWKSVSGQDYQSYDTSSSALNSDSLFLDKSNGDLQIKADRTAAWYVNGKGVAGTLSGSLASDFSGDARSTTYGFGTDIGADEFNAISLPPLATVSGNIAVGDSTNYTFANRTIAKIKWKASTGAYGTNLPTSIAARYFTGATPPDPTNAGNNPSAKYMNSYWTLTPTGGSRFKYDVTLYYDDALLGTVSSETDMRLGKKAETGTGDWKVHFGSVTNTTLNTILFSDLNGFSVFTGSDGLSPLPVQLGWFNAVAQNNIALLNWETITEQNSDVFMILRSIGNGDYIQIGTVKAAGYSVAKFSYQFVDENIVKLAQGAPVHYMIRMVDLDGSYSLSDVRTVQFGAAVSVSGIFPQPAKEEMTVMIHSEENEKMNITVCDLSGKTMIQEPTMLSKGENQFRIRTESLASGIYMIRLSNERETVTYRFLKK